MAKEISVISNEKKLVITKSATWYLLLLVFSIVIQITPSLVCVPIGVVLSFFLYPYNKSLSLAAAFMTFYSSADLTFGGSFSFFGLIFAGYIFGGFFTLRKEFLFCVLLMFIYLLVTLSSSFYYEVDLLYLYYLKTNVYKELFLPIIIMLVFNGLKFDGYEYIKCMVVISFLISIGQIMVLIFDLDVLVYISYQFSISLIILLLVPSKSLKLVALMNIFVYLLLFMKGKLYFSSQDVMLVLVSVSIYFILYRKWASAFIFSSILIFYFFAGTIQGPYLFLKESIGLPPGVAFKLSQVFLVFGSPDFSSIPWSPRVRITEIVNTFDRNVFGNIFGSGYVSFIRESFISFVQNEGEFLNINDFRYDEIETGMFYGLHNTSRGLLHYGLVFFALVSVCFYKTHKLLKSDGDKTLAIVNIFIFSLAVWNPNIMFLFFQMSLYIKLKGER